MPKYGINTTITNDYYIVLEADSLESAISIVNSYSVSDLSTLSIDTNDNRDISAFSEIGE